MVFFAKQQTALAGLEKYLNIPTMPIDTNNTVFAQFYLSTTKVSFCLLFYTLVVLPLVKFQFYNSLCHFGK